MATVSEVTRKAVWDTLCDLEWYIRYFSSMSDQRQKRYRCIRFGLVLGVFVDGALFYVGTEISWVFALGVAFGVALAAITIWDALNNDAADASASRMIVAVCSQLKRENEALWRQIESDAVDQDHTEVVLRSIQDRSTAITQLAHLETNNELNRETQLAANREIEQLYGSQTTA